MAISTVGLHPPFRSCVPNPCQQSQLQLLFRRRRCSSGDLSFRLRRKGSGSSSAAAGIFVCHSNNNNTDNDIIDDDDNDRRRSTEEPIGIQLYNDIERLIVETAKISTRSRGAAAGDWTEIEDEQYQRLPVELWQTEARSAFCGNSSNDKLIEELEVALLKYNALGPLPRPTGIVRFGQATAPLRFCSSRPPVILRRGAMCTCQVGSSHNIGTFYSVVNQLKIQLVTAAMLHAVMSLQEVSEAIPLFSPVIIPMAQGFGPLLSQLMSSPSIRSGAEMALKQLENVNPVLMKQVLPLVEQLSPLYMDLAKGREDFIPKPEETCRLTPHLQLQLDQTIYLEKKQIINPFA
ncbi:hypothetical protein ACLOJK_023903 [Asimina triloba]